MSKSIIVNRTSKFRPDHSETFLVPSELFDLLTDELQQMTDKFIEKFCRDHASLLDKSSNDDSCYQLIGELVDTAVTLNTHKIEVYLGEDQTITKECSHGSTYTFTN